MKRILKKFAVFSAFIAMLVMVLAIMANAETYELSTTTKQQIKIVFDDTSSTMTISFAGKEDASINWWTTLTLPEGSDAMNFVSEHKAKTKHLVFSKFDDVVADSSNSWPFSDMPSLESVYFDRPTRIRKISGMFSGCTNLNTVWFVDDANKIEGCANFSGVSISSSDDPTKVLTDTFKDCAALKSIILPKASGFEGSLNASMFSGCTALEWVRADDTIVTVADDTFEGLEAFKGLIASIGTPLQIWASENNLYPSIWDRKPEADDNTVSGYCTINKYNEYSNVKWEYHNIGTTADPEWTLYFFIDENAPAENTSCVVSSSARLTSHMKGQGNPTSSGTYYGYANSSGAEKYLPYYIENPTLFSSLKYISIAEGINELYGACFIAAPCEAVELPTTLTTAIGFGSFKNMAKLHTVYTRGSDIVKGTADFSNVARIRFTNSQYTFAGCSAIEQYIFKSNVNFGSASTSKLLYGSFMNNTSLKSFNYPTATSAGKTIEKQAFAGCSSLKEITFGNNITSIASDAFENCTALEAIWAPIGSTAHAFALENSYDTNHTLVSDSDANVLMTYDPETQTVSFLNNPEVTPDWAYQFTAEYAKTFINAYKNYAVKAYIDSFGKIRTYNYSFFDNWPSLKEVHFKNEMPRIEIRDGYYLFNNCDALTTVWCGEEAAKQNNVVHFPSLSASLSETQLSELTENLLYDCGAVKSVILPDKAYSITANTFYNCTSLKELTIPASVTGIADDAFFGCTSLRKINLLAPSSIITAGSVNGVKGLVIYTQSAEDADAINTTLAEGGVATSTAFAFYKTGMSIDGYSVRTTAKNGLRTHFIFDKSAVSGYDLIEYGTLSAAAKTWANYSQSYGADDSVLKLEGGEFVTPNDASIVKTPIYQNGNYVNNSVDLANGNRHFSVTIVNFIGEDQIKAELVSVGYEIWEKDGNYYVLFTHEDAYGYDTISLYKTTLGMLSDKVISVSMDENDPVWGTLNACEKTEVTTTDADITAYTFTDPINTDKVIAIYLTASEAETALTDLGIDYDDRSNVSAFVFGKNVIYDLPLIDAYWEEHIEEKIASIPEGKSFIAYTDTHYQSNGERNTGKAPELIQYVRKRTGIDKVFNLGDPYSGEDTADEAEQFFELTVGEYFHDVFGYDAFFAVGNHDANYVSSFNDDLTSEEEKSIAYKYLLPDTKIYEIGYAPLEGRPGVVFDNAMVKLADSLDYTVAEEFGLTEEYLKKEFIAWAKQHYYFDDADNKIRFITLNTGNCGIVEYYLFDKMFWNAVFPTQYNFVYDALCTAPDGYDIVIIGHMFGNSEEQNRSQWQFFKLLCAFSGGYDVTIGDLMSTSANKNILTCGNPQGIENKVYEFDTPFDGAIFTVGGHWHQDHTRVWASVNGSFWNVNNIDYDASKSYSDEVFSISIETDSVENKADVGTPNENSFCVITITEDNRIVVTGFGRAASRSINY